MSVKSYLNMYVCIYIYIQNTPYCISIDGHCSLFLTVSASFSYICRIPDDLFLPINLASRLSRKLCLLLAGYAQAYFY